MAKCILFWFHILILGVGVGVESVIARNETNEAPDSTRSLVHIGLVLNLNSTEGAMAKLCVEMAVSDFYSAHSHYRTRLVLHGKDAEGILATASAVIELLKNEEVRGIIGPQRSIVAPFVTELGKAQVPILSLFATSPSLSPKGSPYFIATTPGDSSPVKAIADIFQGFGWHEVVILYEDTEYGYEIIPHLNNAFNDADIHFSYMSSMSTSVDDFQIRKELKKLMTMQTRVFLVHMNPSLRSRLFVLAKEAGMMSEGYAWFMTDGLSNLQSSMDAIVIDSMEGVLGIRPYIPKSKDVQNFKTRWRKNWLLLKPNSTTTELNIFGLRAYDTVWALAMAVEMIGPMDSVFLKEKYNDSACDFTNFGISEFCPRLVNEIPQTRFRGLSGEFNLVDGRLKPLALEIFNVIGQGDRTVGYWTPDRGICRELDICTGEPNPTYSSSTGINELKTIIWPGDKTTKPKGWAIPTVAGKKLKAGGVPSKRRLTEFVNARNASQVDPIGDKKLRVLVPLKKGFTEFVNVTTHDPHPNRTVEVTGLSIAVFCEALKLLPCEVHPEFYAFVNDTGEGAGTYNDLVIQISNKAFDVGVGDISVVSDRAAYVDFTLPYSETGFVKVVPIKYDRHKDMWIFLKPFTWDLWLVIAATCVFIGFVVRVLEHGRENTDIEFKGPTPQQLGLLFWSPLLMVAFPERKMVANNWSRLVLLIWLLMAFILMQSFTANLSSFFTLDLLQAPIPKDPFVGYQEGSFLKGVLVNKLKYKEENIKAYATIEDYHSALSSGSIAAFYDEIPYIKLFLNKYPSKYKRVGPLYKTDGFGFVLPLKHPLVAPLSRAILNVTQGNKMSAIEAEYMGPRYASEYEDIPISPANRALSAYNFGGLFIITGFATILAVLFSETSFGQRVVTMIKHCTKRKISNGNASIPRQPPIELNPTGDIHMIDNQEDEFHSSLQRDASNIEQEEEIRSNPLLVSS